MIGALNRPSPNNGLVIGLPNPVGFPRPGVLLSTAKASLSKIKRSAARYVYFEHEPVRRGLTNRLTSDEASKVASNIGQLPDF